MPTPANTDLGTLLSAVVTRLIAANYANVLGNVFLSLKPDAALVFPPNDQFLVVCPGRQVVYDPVRVGAGRSFMLLDGEMTVSLWVRLALDQTPRDDSWLTDASLGALKTLGCIINSLELYQPLDGSGNQLLPVGYELKSVDTYSRDVKDGSGGVIGWGEIRTTWEFRWSLNLAC